MLPRLSGALNFDIKTGLLFPLGSMQISITPVERTVTVFAWNYVQ